MDIYLSHLSVFMSISLYMAFFKQFPSVTLTYLFICQLIDGSIDVDRHSYIDVEVIIYVGNAMNKNQLSEYFTIGSCYLHCIKILYCF